MTEKTRIQWFNNLPEDTRQKAIANYMATGRDNWQHTFKSMKECLAASFSFEHTPEGAEYWNETAEGEWPLVPTFMGADMSRQQKIVQLQW